MQKNKFTSHKEYLFGLLFSENVKKIDDDQKSVQEETTHKPSKVYYLRFIPCDNWKTLFFMKVIKFYRTFFNYYVLAFFEKVIWKKYAFYFLSPQF